jgi:ribosomal protein S18 acetylase RimI-like enzyme
MEALFGSDFSGVRIHVGRQAASIGALAFTRGSEIHFAPGQFNPATPQGRQLIGHELTHVLQQRAGRVRNPYGSGLAIVQDPGLEAEAQRMGVRAVQQQAQPSPAAGAPGVAQRQSAGQYHVTAPAWNRNSIGRVVASMSGSGVPVGAVEIRPRGADRMEIANLRVQPEHRRHGVAKLLVQAAIEAGRQAGVALAELEARPSDGATSPRALASLYRGLGFREVGLTARNTPLMQRTTSRGGHIQACMPAAPRPVWGVVQRAQVAPQHLVTDPPHIGQALPAGFNRGYLRFLVTGRTVYKTSLKDPTQVFNNGWNKNGGYDDIVRHVTVNQGVGSNWISTSKSITAAEGLVGQYGDKIFEIELNDYQGVDADDAVHGLTGHHNPFQWQEEIAVYKIIRPEQVVAVWLANPHPRVYRVKRGGIWEDVQGVADRWIRITRQAYLDGQRN